MLFFLQIEIKYSSSTVCLLSKCSLKLRGWLSNRHHDPLHIEMYLVLIFQLQLRPFFLFFLKTHKKVQFFYNSSEFYKCIGIKQKLCTTLEIKEL